MPQFIFPTVVGCSDNLYGAQKLEKKEFYVGPLAQPLRDSLQLTFPVERGIVTDWDAMEKIWHHTIFTELHIDPRNHPFLLMDDPLTPKAPREKMVQTFFETFDAPALFLGFPAVMSIYNSGRTTGLSLDCGYSDIRAVPVYEGYALPHAITYLPLGGFNIDAYLMNYVIQRGYSFTNAAQRDIITNIKETLCYVSQDFARDSSPSKQSIEVDHPLADGQVITVGTELFRCTESLFQPSLFGVDHNGVHKLIYDTIMKCEPEIRQDLFKNIVISGGSSMFPGFVDRLQQELKTLAPDMEIVIIAPEGRQYSAWSGASTLAYNSTFSNMWITSRDYDESGPSVVHRKCF